MILDAVEEQSHVIEIDNAHKSTALPIARFNEGLHASRYQLSYLDASFLAELDLTRFVVEDMILVELASASSAHWPSQKCRSYEFRCIDNLEG